MNENTIKEPVATVPDVRSDSLLGRPTQDSDTPQDAPVRPNQVLFDLYEEIESKVDKEDALLEEMWDQGVEDMGIEFQKGKLSGLRAALYCALHAKRSTAVANGKYRLVVEFSDRELKAIRR